MHRRPRRKGPRSQENTVDRVSSALTLWSHVKLEGLKRPTRRIQS